MHVRQIIIHYGDSSSNVEIGNPAPDYLAPGILKLQPGWKGPDKNEPSGEKETNQGEAIGES